MPATNKRLSIRTPVIAAIGEVTDRPDRIEEAREPVELMAAALRAAEADGGRSLLAALTSVYLVGQMKGLVLPLNILPKNKNNMPC